MSTIGFHRHDHDHCITDTMARAQALCAEEGLQFTPVRQRVLEILLAEHRALGAYDILPMLAEDGLGSQPPVAYRALDFLVKNGLAHRIELLNAYIACAHLGRAHRPAFLICRGCGSVAEAEAPAPLADSAGATGFHVETTVVEAEGLCPQCHEADPG